MSSQRRRHHELVTLPVPAPLHDALQLLDVGGDAAICAGVQRVLDRMLKWNRTQSAPDESAQPISIVPVVNYEARSAALGMFAPLPDQVILSIFERLQSADLRK
jgi:hypothetical protein